VVVGQYTDAGTVEVNPHWNTNRKHLEIRGCWGTDFSHVYRGVKVVAKHGEGFTSDS
jgi:L-iditol 2-dehydrogenase